MERYESRFSLEPNLHMEGCPVLIQSGGLYFDNTTKLCLALMKFNNISEQSLESMRASIQLFSAEGEPLGERIRHLYAFQRTDMKDGIPPYMAGFGAKEPIIIGDKRAASFTVRIDNVRFLNGSEWIDPKTTEWDPLPQPNELIAEIGEALIPEYKDQCGAKGPVKYVPMRYQDVWICTCGAVNPATSENCQNSACEMPSLETALIALNSENLRASANQKEYAKAEDLFQSGRYEEAEKLYNQLGAFLDCGDKAEQCRVAAKQHIDELSAKRKKTIRRAITAIAALAALIAIVIVVTKVTVPNSHYQKGLKLTAAEQWDEAIAEFEQIPEYKDSQQQILAVHYAHGKKLLEQKDYGRAVKEFNLAKDYEDADKQILNAYYTEGIDFLEAGNWDQAIQRFKKARNYSDAETKILEVHYRHADALINEGKWTKAIDELTEAGEYLDAKERIPATHYQYAVLLRENKEWESALAEFKEAGDYEDASDQITETRYAYASALANDEKWRQASDEFKALGDYKDASDRVNLCNAHCPGRSIFFGHYEQDNKTETGTEPIEWRVLEVKDGKCYLASVQILDTIPFDTDKTSGTWEQSTLRTWLNDEFYNSAFSEKEKTALVKTSVDNKERVYQSGNYCDQNEEAPSTDDLVWIPDRKECQRLNLYSCTPTAFAKEKGIRIGSKTNSNSSPFWIRNDVTTEQEPEKNKSGTSTSYGSIAGMKRWEGASKQKEDPPKPTAYKAAIKGTDNNIATEYCISEEIGVKPIICIDLNSELFR